ncbi:hypothetical protein LRF89_08140 [Halorhodospira sp. 9621]|uniref:NfeD family protein n=1 Tax=Halorhodospira sp. 9621 TaxID=2899135 RepID=UPI001EE787D0|nr:NfeD family protein [Halorhodospira sp. 9621]MCG5533411.1 hypothetical protein [Halorhodospira sp. 9621]
MDPMNDPQSVWTVWLTLAVVLLGVEILLAGGGAGVLLALAVMAFAGMAMALLGAPLVAQIAVAILAGLASLPFMVWVFRRMGRGGGPPSADDSALRRTAFEAYYDLRGHLRVRAFGDHLMAIPDPSDDPEIAPGSAVRIVRLEGTRAIVRPVDAPVGARLDDAEA